MRIYEVVEAFSDLGKLSPDELKKGQKLDQHGQDNFKQVPGRVFAKAISQIRSNDMVKANKGLPSKGLDTLHVYKPNEYNQMDCYLGNNNSSGYCLKGGELVSVFSTQGSSASAIMQDAVKNGARELDCYAIRDPKTNTISGPLYRLYSKFGFKIDKNLNQGNSDEPYAIQNGISSFVDDNGNVHPDDPRVVIFMKR